MTNVLFVCVHNAGRSQMAEAMLNHFARVRGVAASAESAGTQGGKQVNPLASQAMAEVGVDMSGQLPKLLDQAMVDRADLIITMGCGVDAEACPARFLVSEDWALPDPNGESLDTVRAIRDQIEKKVEQLLERLAKNPNSRS